MITPKHTAYVIGSVFLASTLTACGDSAADEFADQSAKEIAKASAADMGDLKSVQVKAEIDSDGDTIKLDLQLSTAGDCTGKVGIGEGSAEVLAVDGDAWFKPNKEFFEQVISDPAQLETVTAAVDGKYIKDEQGQFTDFCDLDELLQNVTEVDDDEKVTKGERSDVDGEDAIIIEGETDSGDPSKAYVATGESHYILKFSSTGDEAGEATFSKFDEKVDVKAPAEDDVADLGSLG